METLINIMLLVNLILSILLVVALMAHMDRRYAAKVRAEYKRKSILRGNSDD
ncbi:MAG: hypothetical protein AAGF56_08250 [Pseudomonadota bacterium]